MKRASDKARPQVSASVLPAWVLLVASVSFMLDHLVMPNGHRGAYDLHARETDSAATVEAGFESESPQGLSFPAPIYMFYSSTAAVVLLNS